MFDHCAAAHPQTVCTPRSQRDSHLNTQRKRKKNKTKTNSLAFKHSQTDGRFKVLANNSQLCKNIYPYIILGGLGGLVIILGAQFPEAPSK